MARQRKYELAAAFCIFFLIASAAAAPGNDVVKPSGTTTNSSGYSITVFIPAVNSVHSDQINAMINGYNGSVITGTSFGLSTFDGTWKTLHINRDNFSEGLLNDFVTAVELDNKKNLWIGYSGGIQIFNGHTYQTLRDQQLFKDPRITDLQRWNDDMWVATGNAGIHRYRNGSFTWFQPGTKTGSPFFTATSMALDATGNTSLVITTRNEGQWLLRSSDDPVRFERIDTGENILDPLQQVRSDPFGGVYLFNGSSVMHYTVGSGCTPVLSSADLTFVPVRINDLSGSKDGTLYLATDNGIYVWRDGGVARRISSFDGIGPTNIVKFIFADNEKRVWYASQGYVGFLVETMQEAPLIPVELVTPSIVPQAPETSPTSLPQPTVTIPATVSLPDSIQGIFFSIVDPVLRALRTAASRFGPTLP